MPDPIPNFDLYLGPARDNRHPLRVMASPAGECSPVWQPLPNDAEFRRLLAYVHNGIARAGHVETMGMRLRAWLLPQPIAGLFDRARSATGETGLRLRLHLDANAPELAQVPWEVVRDDHGFLALNRTTPLVRYQPTDRPPQPLAQPIPLRLLLATASPAGMTPLDVAAEAADIEVALAPLLESGILTIQTVTQATRRSLREALRHGAPHLFHFMGHGLHLPGGEGAIALVGADGAVDPLSADDLLTLVRDSALRLALLTACHTAVSDPNRPAAPLLGLAPRLVWGGLPAVVAMQVAIADRAAITFSQALYAFLAAGAPLDAAVTEARLALYVEDRSRAAWAIPALFMRAPDGRLWQPPPAEEGGGLADRPRFTIRAGKLRIGHLVQGVYQEGGEPVDWSGLLPYLPDTDIQAEDMDIQQATQGMAYRSGSPTPDLPAEPLLAALRTQIDELDLPAENREALSSALTAVSAELAKPQSNRARLLARLEEAAAIVEPAAATPTGNAFLAQLLVARQAAARQTSA